MSKNNPIGMRDQNRKFGHNGNLDRLQELLLKYGIKSDILGISNGKVQLTAREKVDEYLARSVLKEEGYGVEFKAVLN